MSSNPVTNPCLVIHSIPTPTGRDLVHSWFLPLRAGEALHTCRYAVHKRRGQTAMHRRGARRRNGWRTVPMGLLLALGGPKAYPRLPDV